MFNGAGGALPLVPCLRSCKSLEDADIPTTDGVHKFLDRRLDMTRQSRGGVVGGIPTIGRPLASYDLTLDFTFLNKLGEDRKKFLNRSILDGDFLTTLEHEGTVNWQQTNPLDGIRPPGEQVCKFLALRTRGDGNCLLHSASLAMWGVDDTYLRLRRAVHDAVAYGDAATELRKRWRHATEVENRRANFTLDEAQWQTEWTEHIVRLCAPMPKGNNGYTYDSLTEFHIFVLAQVLLRPIICYAKETMPGVHGEHFSPVHMAGVYLPVTADKDVCIKSPLTIAFSGGHFVGLIRKNNTGLVPLCKKGYQRLPMPFLLPNEEGRKEKLLDEYLTHSYVQMPPAVGSSVLGTFAPMDVATVAPVTLPSDLSRLTRVFAEKFDDLFISDVAARCRRTGCENFHGDNTVYCSKCSKDMASKSGSGSAAAGPALDTISVTSVASSMAVAPSAPALPDDNAETTTSPLLNMQYCTNLGCLVRLPAGSEGELCQSCLAWSGGRNPAGSTATNGSERRSINQVPHPLGNQRPPAVSPTVTAAVGTQTPPTNMATTAPAQNPTKWRLPPLSVATLNATTSTAAPRFCIEADCQHYGSEGFDGRCSRCYGSHKERENLRQQQARPSGPLICQQHGCNELSVPGSSSLCAKHQPSRRPVAASSSSSSSASSFTRSQSDPASPPATTPPSTLPSALSTNAIATSKSPSSFIAAPPTPLPTAAAGPSLSPGTCATPGCSGRDVSEFRGYCGKCLNNMVALWNASRRNQHRWNCGRPGCKKIVELPRDFCTDCSGSASSSRKGGTCVRQSCNNPIIGDSSRDGGLCQACFLDYGGETRCRESGCRYFASPVQGGYCSSCTDRQKRERIVSQQRAAMRDVRSLVRPGDAADGRQRGRRGAHACASCGSRNLQAHETVCVTCLGQGLGTQSPGRTHVLNDIA